MIFNTLSLSFYLLIIFCSAHILESKLSTICVNDCSGHGYCGNRTHTCSCFPGYTGGDCSLKVCPSNKAWVDRPFADNQAHADFTECSNMGKCNRKTGICECRKGFSGAACDIMLCPVAFTPESIRDRSELPAVCSSKGRCVSLRDVTPYQDFNTYLDYESYTGFWDVDRVHGCVCDPGFEGISCQDLTCPHGDNPNTPGIDEEQLIDCRCSDCEGGMVFVFKGEQTPFIPYNADPVVIKTRLESLNALSTVKIDMVEGTRLCSKKGSVTKVTFQIPQGPQPRLELRKVSGLDGPEIGVRAKGQYSFIKPNEFSAKGTKEYAECSEHGLCNHLFGNCECFDGYRSSDGMGNPGTIGDCGHQLSFLANYTIFNITDLLEIVGVVEQISTPCPFVNEVCNGHGRCDLNNGKCYCEDGYDGVACTEKSCPTSRTWFGDVYPEHSTLSVCGGVGDCDVTTGKCVRCGGGWGIFDGDACGEFTCATTIPDNPCSGNGACLTLREIAELTYNEQKELAGFVYDEPWDADMIRGCLCDRSITVDNQFDINYQKVINNIIFNSTGENITNQVFSDDDLIKFYRGPYAFAATDFFGFACTQKDCPKGNFPTNRGVNEIQQLNCIANNGTFMLKFRENSTLPIAYNATISDLHVALEQLFTIGKVSLSNTTSNSSLDFNFNSSICSVEGEKYINIEFLTEFGDLPLITADTTGIRNIGFGIDDFRNSYVLNITEIQKGTKLEIECSGQGICDTDTGVCHCFNGYTSSNSTNLMVGERGDCGFYNKFYTEHPKFRKN